MTLKTKSPALKWIILQLLGMVKLYWKRFDGPSMSYETLGTLVIRRNEKETLLLTCAQAPGHLLSSTFCPLDSAEATSLLGRCWFGKRQKTICDLFHTHPRHVPQERSTKDVLRHGGTCPGRKLHKSVLLPTDSKGISPECIGQALRSGTELSLHSVLDKSVSHGTLPCRWARKSGTMPAPHGCSHQSPSGLMVTLTSENVLLEWHFVQSDGTCRLLENH